MQPMQPCRLVFKLLRCIFFFLNYSPFYAYPTHPMGAAGLEWLPFFG